MSTDRELLELAAKAAGYSVDFSNSMSMACSDGVYFTHNADTNRWWNPLLDDGDALRLALECQMIVDMRYSKRDSYWAIEVNYWLPLKHGEAASKIAEYSANKQEATRRAIVRSAAEIGKAMS